MATQAEKEKFFAALDSLDVSTDAESNSDIEERSMTEVARKRQKFSRNSKDHLECSELITNSRSIFVSETKPFNQRQLLVATCATRDKSVSGAEQETARPKSRQKINLECKHVKDVSRHQTKTGTKKLFDGLTFFFIPNDDVAKPRRLRIQSAISQGASWARSLRSDITHVIVDPEIIALAVVKFVKNEIDLSTVAVVKTNWLVESLSHKSLRNPSDSRFRLKGASTAFTKTSEQAPDKMLFDNHPVAQYDMSKGQINVSAPLIGAEDELDQIVQDLKTATHLPFDEELDLEDLLSFSSGDERTEEEFKTARRDIAPPQENRGFQCMQASTGSGVPNPNDRTIAILQQMAMYYDRTGDNWRTLAYRKGIAALRKQTELVGTSAQARKIHGIGSRLADKIEEIVATDRLKRLDAVLADPDEQVLQLFMGIYDVGLKQARAWMMKGYRTLEDLIQNARLSENQKVGIQHYQDFAQRIPRDEVAQHGNIVAQSLIVGNKDLQAIIGGSYRRGMPDSGDIDIMITHPTAALSQLRTWVFDIVVPHLFQIGFMKCALATSRLKSTSKLTPKKSTQKLANGNKNISSAPALDATSSSTGTKFLGASCLPSSQIWRRIDLLLVAPDTLGAALIYFTGNDIFNRSLRLLASKKGMRLNQYGLYKDVMRGAGRLKITDGELIEGRSEKKIFEILGVPYRKPEERRC